MTDENEGPARPKRRGLWITAMVVAAVVVTGCGGAAAYAFSASDRPVAKKPIAPATEPIERGTLTGSSKASGSLAFSDPHDIASGSAGVVTGLPQPGTTISAGQSLFSTNNVPTYLFRGDLPAWRAFSSGMDDGPDVKQLEQNLKALGFFSGEPDDEFSWRTQSAITAWQKATGQERTGSIELGRIVFQHGDVRVSALKAAVGDQASPGAPMISVTGTEKQVSVDLRLADQQLAKTGGTVTIDLPGGKQTAGTITSVGTPQEKKDSTTGGTTATIPVVVELDDPAAAGELQQATVTVNFPSEVRQNVLSVPVGALLALSGSQFGVEVVQKNGTTRRVPVKTGLFAGGRVEISGAGLTEGRRVVVPSL
ncbi:peptidoglycan-binding protein [Leifsonia shinshuensis]|uniref:efflux RND transporter periplasmic adaptor subunit n=1 Tax=Leifsonia shinshuensis TaxID=150026 RepID=UPI001F507B81|nr:peptidoglycan-binding protein [Leifsonia shinshuensis]MCI0158780.1 peptidoglycan-binding protein [Leifsonia shinshuensis]